MPGTLAVGCCPWLCAGALQRLVQPPERSARTLGRLGFGVGGAGNGPTGRTLRSAAPRRRRAALRRDPHTPGGPSYLRGTFTPRDLHTPGDPHTPPGTLTPRGYPHTSEGPSHSQGLSHSRGTLTPPGEPSHTRPPSCLHPVRPAPPPRVGACPCRRMPAGACPPPSSRLSPLSPPSVPGPPRCALPLPHLPECLPRPTAPSPHHLASPSRVCKRPELLPPSSCPGLAPQSSSAASLPSSSSGGT
ncbi:uncharacterized protein LOC133625159 [Colius striatus]|uniref:uncharacterized protein LOC133625159 n=1 Tax=Colius striatus TaxID=57412 RepID=UPI002B1E4E81|nr:uncharacterized protein LOC133625159 [Colius striatus]